MNFKELSRLYPEIKIPVNEYAEYYVGLLKNDSGVNQVLKNYKEFLTKYPENDFKKMSYHFVDFHIDKLKPFVLKLSTTDFPEKKYYLRYDSFKQKKIYFSVDLKSANFQVLKHFLKDEFPYKTWAEFTIGFEEIFSQSKSLRQFIFGNTNPKAINRHQEEMMQEIIDFFFEHEILNSIFIKKSDEIIFEFDSYLQAETAKSIFLNSDISKTFELNYCIFTIDIIHNFGDEVKIKNIFTEENKSIKKLIEVPLNRFFIHYKSLMLGQNVSWHDSLFECDKKIAKWIL